MLKDLLNVTCNQNIRSSHGKFGTEKIEFCSVTTDEKTKKTYNGYVKLSHFLLIFHSVITKLELQLTIISKIIIYILYLLLNKYMYKVFFLTYYLN